MTDRERESLLYTAIMGAVGIPLWLFGWFPSPCEFVAIILVTSLLVAALTPDKKKRPAESGNDHGKG